MCTRSWAATNPLATAATAPAPTPSFPTHQVINQLENPFPWLPLQDMAGVTKSDVARVMKDAAELRAIDAAEGFGGS
jgi:hypothetical protein